MSRYFQVKAFINHWLDSVEKHSLHSPFFFDLYEHIVDAPPGEDFAHIESIRENLLRNQSIIEVKDLGSGSAVPALQQNRRKIADIAATSLTPPHLAQLYVKLCEYMDVHNVLELGTSMGLTTLYFSELEDCKVNTFEG